MKNFFILILFITFTYFIKVYNDTEEFQAVMKFIFSSSYNVPTYWQENRMIALGMISLLIILLYHSVWSSCLNLIKIYKNSPLMRNKPPLTVQQSSYILYKKDSLCVSSWLIELCQSGVLSLHYKKSFNPWSVSRNPGMIPASDFDEKLLGVLFKNEDVKEIRDDLYAPDADFQKLSNMLLKKIKSDINPLMHSKISSFFAWFIFIIFLLELAFINSLYPNNPALTVIGLVMSLSTAAAFFALCYQLPYFYFANKGMAFLTVVFIAILSLALHWGGLDIYDSIPYLSTYFYLDIVAAVAGSAMGVHSVTKAPFLLSQMIGYQKYLETLKSPIKESDLLWVVGLESFCELSILKVAFKDNRKPDWLKNNTETLDELIQCLHEKFVGDVECAINGKQKSSSFSSRSSGSSRMGTRY